MFDILYVTLLINIRVILNSIFECGLMISIYDTFQDVV